jgi:cobalt-zinc-cadmium efflux system outer membrane protein
MASVSYTNESLDRFTLGSSDMSTLNLTWSQEVPYSGKLRLAGDVARADIEVKRHDAETVRRSVLAGVKAAYAEVFRIDRTRSVLLESRKLLESFLESARRRYESGEGILENVLKAQTEITRLDVELEALAQERRSAEARLNVLAGRPAGAPLGTAVTPLVAGTVDEAALEAGAVESSPVLLSRQAAARREEIRLDLAKRSLKPDFAWSAAYMNRGGLDPMVMGMFGVRLPLYRDRKQEQAVAGAQEDLEAARNESDGARLQIASSVRDLVARAEGARAKSRLYGEGVLPQSRSALDSAAASYAAGRAEFLTLIADFLTVLDAEKSLAAQQAEEAFALAALEPLTGTTLLTPAEPEGDRHE